MLRTIFSFSAHCNSETLLYRGSFARSHAGPHIVKESEQQQAIADNLPSAEDAAAATTEQQARASNSAIPRLTASNTASSAQAGSAPAAAPAPANSAHVTAKAVQDSSELQQTKQVSQGGDIPNTRQGRSKLNRKQLIHSARTADVAVPQAASDSSGRFRGFE